MNNFKERPWHLLFTHMRRRNAYLFLFQYQKSYQAQRYGLNTVQMEKIMMKSNQHPCHLPRKQKINVIVSNATGFV